MAEIKTGIFAKNVQKRLNRAQEKVLQKLGKADETKDEQFEQVVVNFRRQESEGARLQREMKAYMSAIKGMQQASINLTQSLHEVYEPDWHGKEDIVTIGKDCDALWEDFHNKLVDSTLLNLDAYLQEFPDLKIRVAKRSRKLIDYDSARHHLETLQMSGMKNDRKVMKAEEELKKAQKVFDELDTGLQDELPTLWDRRVGFYISTYKSVTTLEAKFHREISQVCRELYEVMTKLGEQHSDKIFTIQGAPSDSGPLRLARTPSPPEDESPPESPDVGSNHMLRPISPGPPRPKSPTQLKKGPPVPPPPKVTPTKEVAEEQIIDLFGGDFLPAPSQSLPNERPGESLLDLDFDAFQPDESVSPIPQTAVPWDMWSANAEASQPQAADAGFVADWSADFGSVSTNGDAAAQETPAEGLEEEHGSTQGGDQGWHQSEGFQLGEDPITAKQDSEPEAEEDEVSSSDSSSHHNIHQSAARKDQSGHVEPDSDKLSQADRRKSTPGLIVTNEFGEEIEDSTADIGDPWSRSVDSTGDRGDTWSRSVDGSGSEYETAEEWADGGQGADDELSLDPSEQRHVQAGSPTAEPVAPELDPRDRKDQNHQMDLTSENSNSVNINPNPAGREEREWSARTGPSDSPDPVHSDSFAESHTVGFDSDPFAESQTVGFESDPFRESQTVGFDSDPFTKSQTVGFDSDLFAESQTVGFDSDPFRESQTVWFDSDLFDSDPFRESQTVGFDSDPFRESQTVGFDSDPFRESQTVGFDSDPFRESQTVGFDSDPFRESQTVGFDSDPFRESQTVGFDSDPFRESQTVGFDSDPFRESQTVGFDSDPFVESQTDGFDSDLFRESQTVGFDSDPVKAGVSGLELDPSAKALGSDDGVLRSPGRRKCGWDSDPFADRYPATLPGTEGPESCSFSTSGTQLKPTCGSATEGNKEVPMARNHKEPEKSDVSEDEAANQRYGRLYQELDTGKEEDASAPSFANFDQMSKVQSESSDSAEASEPQVADESVETGAEECERPHVPAGEVPSEEGDTSQAAEEHEAPPADEEHKEKGSDNLKDKPEFSEEEPKTSSDQAASSEKMPIPSVVIEPASSNEGDDDRDADIISPTNIRENMVTSESIKHMSASGGTSGHPDDFLYKVETMHDFEAANSDELDLKRGDVVLVVPTASAEDQDAGWLTGIKESDWSTLGVGAQRGLFPENFTQRLQ
ncbi:amphiphysin [Austrofundulus limnaeus]|uniref:Amphiphysin n=2 Tax=Austrofundulus limnaeus TaxID=52670 RepID=A0A2I4D2M4_AUSLI|nr:PREDICTED: amphiphysin-like [Austrofundulus limnaeus]